MKRALFVLAGICVAGASQATLLWDYGMSTGGYGGSWANTTGGQEFADIAVFTSAVSVTQYIYFTNFDPFNFGTMHVKVFADAGGIPGAPITTQDLAVSGYNIDGVYGGETVYRVALNLSTPVNLGAGTYWWGASGNAFEAAQVSLNNPAPGDGLMAMYISGSYNSMATVGDQAYQLNGSIVPEPATLLALGGFSALLLLRRKRR